MVRSLSILVMVGGLCLSCDRSTDDRGAPRPAPADSDAAGPRAPRPDGQAGDGGQRAPTCEERGAAAREQIEQTLAGRRTCRWDVDCVIVEVETRCAAACGLAVASASVLSARSAVSGRDRALCATLAEAGCEQSTPSCGEQAAACMDSRCEARPGDQSLPARPQLEVPSENAADRAGPPPRPEPGDAEERARRLFQAIVADDPARAMDFFFPREAFLEVKGMRDPGRYYDRLLARYLRDIHDLHTGTPDLNRAEFVRLELVQRGGWVEVREEGNRLPYWASRHSWIHYRVGEEQRRLEVRVLITWGERWYVIHLSEFR